MVQLGNHWLTPDGAVVIWDDGRQALPFNVPPRTEVQTVLTVTTPAAPGQYLLELDVVQEAVAWFKHKSSTPALIPAEIVPSVPVEVAAMAHEAAPRMEMYGVKRDEVIGIMTSAGARVLDVVPDEWAGPDWIGFQYFATRA